MEKKILSYEAAGIRCQGYVAWDNDITDMPRPAVLVAPAWRGLDAFAKSKAEELAALGYVGIAVDFYGEGKTAADDAAASALMTPLFCDRSKLRERLCAAYDAAAALDCVDPSRIGAIGFCFGGLAVIELLRSGKALKGVTTFHALLGDTLGEHTAKTAPSQPSIPAHILLLHGAQDPLVSQHDIFAFQKEMTQHHVDWQFHIYGDTSHAFTNPEARDAKSGLSYNPVAAQRAWQAMRNFFTEVFSK